MQIDFIVEEPSAQMALDQLLPALLGNISFNVVSLGSKSQLLSKLPARLNAYAQRIGRGEQFTIFVLVDEDRQDCLALKAQLEGMATAAGLRTRSTCGARPLNLVNRIVVEELEAWFFGDTAALVAAYPRVPATLGQKAAYRDPDAIKGGTWEQLEKVLQDAGYYKAGLPKMEVAQKVSGHMDPHRNRSRSFQVFYQAVREVVQAATA